MIYKDTIENDHQIDGTIDRTITVIITATEIIMLSKFGGDNASTIVATRLMIKIGTPKRNRLNVGIPIEYIPTSM